MLPLEKQVCRLEYAKKLKELGVKQHGYFYYIKYLSGSIGLISIVDEDTRIYAPCCETWDAFTVAELGVMLPHILTINGHEYDLRHYKLQDEGHSFWAPTYFNAHVDIDTAVKDGMMKYDKGSDNEFYSAFIAYPYFKHDTDAGEWMKFSEADNRAFLLISLLEDKIITVSEINEKY